MKKFYEIRFNSQRDLENKVAAFRKQHPNTKYDETEIKRAKALAVRMDNETKRSSDSATLKIEYSEA